MPLTKFQKKIFRIIFENRNPDSYIAGGSAICIYSNRVSYDIDIFHENEKALAQAVEKDITALKEHNIDVKSIKQRIGIWEAIASENNNSIELDWVSDSSYRFFPIQQHPIFGCVLHPIDIAANKVSAAANRREARDILDLLTINEKILPLGPLVAAAVDKFPGQSPEEMLEDIKWHTVLTKESYESIKSIKCIEPAILHKKIKKMLMQAEDYLQKLPTKYIGYLFINKQNKIIQPDINKLEIYTLHHGKLLGHWPNNRQITPSLLNAI